jgi:SAM-dependent methyltransferase
MRNKMDEFYVALENRFRGGAELIRERQMVYVPLIKYVMQTVGDGQQYDFVDVGCGRGEWMSLLRENGVKSKGIDTNAEMINLCKLNDLDVIHGDALAYFKYLPDNCLAGVSAFHVVEHLDLETSLSLLTEIQRCLVEGGMAFFETPNPENVSVGSHTFYIDPTHTKPIPPVLLSFMFEFCGFFKNEIVRLHPIRQPYEGEIPTAAAAHMFHHFFGAQDYAVVGFKQEPPLGALQCLPGYSVISEVGRDPSEDKNSFVPASPEAISDRWRSKWRGLFHDSSKT